MAKSSLVSSPYIAQLTDWSPGYPGTAGTRAAVIGFIGASPGSTVVGSFGSGGCNTSTALSQVGGEALAIIYSR